MYVHTPTKSLILKVRDIFAVRELLPRYSRAVAFPDGHNVAVKWTLDSARLLRNIGIAAPSPIVSFYKWPGMYKPMSHQIEMASFQTLHDKCFNLSEQGCVSADTEYLSPTGWKRIDQYDGGQVAQYWPETGEIEMVDAEYIKLPCEQMIRIKARGIDQLLSPEHRVLLADGRVVRAEEVLRRYGTQDQFNRSLKFRTTFKVRGAGGIALTDEQIRVQVAANADGWFQVNRVYVRLKRQRKIERLRSLLVAANIEFWERPCLPDGFIKFSFEPPMAKGYSDEWWKCDQHQIKIVAEEAVHWDGSAAVGGRGVRFAGTRRDTDFIQYVWSANGTRVSAGWDKRSVDTFSLTASQATEPGLYGRVGGAKHVYYEPSPDGFKYCFMVPSTFLLLRRNGCIAATGNTGKTYATLWALDYLMNEGKIKRALIMCPLSSMVLTWTQDIFKILPHRVCSVIHGTAERRMKNLQRPIDIYVLNHDGIDIEAVAKEVRKRKDIDIIVVDEASFFRNAQIDKYRFLAWVAERKLKLWLMSGTPCPNAPTDAWALSKLVDPSLAPQFFGRFRDETMYKDGMRWLPKRGSEARAYEIMQPAIRFRKRDCLDLPPLVSRDIQTQLSSEQKAAVKLMRDEMIMFAKEHQINAVNGADKITKLRQILLGAVKDPKTGEYHALDCRQRLRDLRTLISQANAKVIVIVPFKGILRIIAKELPRPDKVTGLPGYSVEIMNGDVTAKERVGVVTRFKTQEHPHVLVCQERVMSHGLNLTEADTTIFYGPINSNDCYAQVIERFNRLGQKNTMSILRMVGHPIEAAIYKSVDARGTMQSSILELYKNFTEGKDDHL